MAINSNASFIPTLNEFVAHWAEVNDARPPGAPLILRTGQTRQDLHLLRVDLMDVETQLQQRLNDAQIARGQIELHKRSLMMWFGRFMQVFDGYYGAGPLGQARPAMEVVTASVEKFIKPMLDMGDLWDRINVLTAPPGVVLPLTLVGELETETLTHAEFVILYTNLRSYADQETIALGRAKRSRSRRDFTQKDAYAAMKTYRLAMPAALPAGNELQGTLPRLTPEDTGAAPDPVAASAVYVSGDTSRTVYEESTSEELKEYQLRGVAGEEWNEEDAVTIATNPPGAPREFTVNFGLTQPGTKIALKVYVVTLGGRERGSAAMVVERV